MSPQTKTNLLGFLLLLLASAVVYAPAWDGDFLWDDDSYVTENRTLTEPGGLRAIWFSPGATTQYYPLVHTTYWIESRLWGFDPRGYHIVNILLHAISAMLLATILRRLDLPGAFAAALLFAVHPVCVESVAWITERKNVLSLALALGSMLLYFRHREKGGAGLLAASGALFLGALLAKTVVASLPAVIAVMIWWREGRLPRKDTTRLAPLLAIGVIMGLVTVWIERNYIGAQGSEWALSFLERTQLASHNVIFYAGKVVWPSPLTFFYPRWTPDAANFLQWIPLFALAGAAAAGWLLRARIGRGPLATLLLFAGVLFPALGFIDVYPFRYSFVADHFQYHAVPVLVCAIAVLVARTIQRARIPRVGGALLLATTAAGLLGVAHGEAHTYRNLETLWRDTIEENDTAWMALNNLGQMLARRGEHGEAIALYEAAIRVKSPYPKAQNNLATSLAAIGRGDQALAQYRAAIEADPANMNARSNLGLALVNAGRIEEGIAVLKDAIAINPRMPSLHTNLGVAYARGGDVAGALESFRRVVSLTPADPEAHFRVALTLDQAGDRRGALLAMEEVLRIQPGHPGATAWTAQNR